MYLGQQILTRLKRFAIATICLLLDCSVYAGRVTRQLYTYYTYLFYFIYTAYSRFCVKRHHTLFTPLIMHGEGWRFRVHAAGFADGITEYTPAGQRTTVKLDMITQPLESFLILHEWNAKLLKTYLEALHCYRSRHLTIYYQRDDESHLRMIKWDLDAEKNLVTNQPLCFGDLSIDEYNSVELK